MPLFKWHIETLLSVSTNYNHYNSLRNKEAENYNITNYRLKPWICQQLIPFCRKIRNTDNKANLILNYV